MPILIDPIALKDILGPPLFDMEVRMPHRLGTGPTCMPAYSQANLSTLNFLEMVREPTGGFMWVGLCVVSYWYYKTT